MASIKVKSEPKEEPVELVKVLHLTKKEGWFIYQEIEIPKDILDKHGKIISQTEPDIFPIFKEQLINKAMDIYDI